MRKHPIRSAIILICLWVFVNLAGVLGSWSRAYFADIDTSPQKQTVDLRTDKSSAGRLVSIIATKPTPQKGDYIGHMWIVWPETLPRAPSNTRETGYYARDQLQAIRAMAVALLAPWGFATGQSAVPGYLKADDGWWRHVQVDVLVDELRYQAAVEVDNRWRSETRYSLRPGIAALGGAGRTWGCQDYVLEVAGALGLKASRRNWTQFPMGAFLDFADENDLTVKPAPDRS
jgi:hypothetical protein